MTAGLPTLVGQTLSLRIDETTQSDADYIKSSVEPFNEVAEFRLDTADDRCLSQML